MNLLEWIVWVEFVISWIHGGVFVVDLSHVVDRVGSLG